MKELCMLLGALLLYAGVMCLIAILGIWSLNVLFDCGIPYSFKTIIAMWLICSVLCYHRTEPTKKSK